MKVGYLLTFAGTFHMSSGWRVKTAFSLSSFNIFTFIAMRFAVGLGKENFWDSGSSLNISNFEEADWDTTFGEMGSS